MNPPSFGFGAGGGGGFGASQSPFGAQSQAAQGSPFGAPASGGMFGSQQPGFGAASQPAFGGSSPFGGGGGGGGGFGAKPAVPSSPFGAPAGGFGAPAASPFGQPSSTPAFGGGSAFGSAASSPGFGASAPGFGASAPGFGAAPASPFGSAQTTSAFGSGGFGAAASPAGGFGTSSPAGGFGTSSPAGGFGSSTGAYGAGGQGYSAFGAPASGFSGSQGVGTLSVKYQDTVEQDTTGGSLTSLKYHSISAMPAYRNKTFEELRAEDYQAGVKGNTGTPAAGPSGQSPFGAPSSGSPFGTPAAGTGFGGSGFGGASSGFGGASSGFGAQSSPAFGAGPSPGFGGATTAFGATSSAPAGSVGGFGTAKPAFGAAATSGFGSSAPAFGAGGQSSFGAPSTQGFGGAPSSGFGATSSASGFGASGTPSFGGGAPGFGSTTGGLFGQSSSPAFSGASAASFGASSGPAFGASGGQFGTSSAPAFGASTGAGIFGTGSAPSFGGGLFGSTPAGGGGMFGASGASQSSTPSFGAGGFGAKPAASFGAAPTSSGGLFGATSSPSFGLGAFGTGGGSTPAASQGTFGTPGGTPLFQGSQGGFAAKPPSQYGSPYGSLPTVPPNGGYPDSASKPSMVSSARVTSSLLSPRTIAPVSLMKLRPRGSSTLSRTRSPGSPATAFFDVGTKEYPVAPRLESTLLKTRENPRQLFIRAPPEEAAAALLAATKSPDDRPSPCRSAQDGGSEEEITEVERASSKPVANGEKHFHMNDKEGEGAKITSAGAREVPTLSSPKHADKAKASPLLPRLCAVDYFTKPDMASLEAMAQRDPDALACVENFTVGRRGVGTVRWLAPIDVRGLDLDNLVKFQSREIRVYLDEEDKPPVGEGLNQPAEVTLLGIYRIDKATGKPMTDERTVRKMREKLSRVVQEQTDGQGKMIDYDAVGGVWRFQVEHFSRYGLDEGEDEEEEGWDASLQQDERVPDESYQVDSAGKSGSLEENGGIGAGKVFGLQDWENVDTQTSSEDKGSWEDEDLGWEEDRQMHEAPLGKVASISSPFDAAAQEVQEMWKASLWDKRDTSVPLRPSEPRLVHHAWRQASASPIHWSRAASKMTPAATTHPTRGGCAVVRQSMDTSLKQTNTTLFDKESTRSRDLGLFLGASFRVGWGPGGVLVTACTSHGASAASLVIHRVHCVDERYEGKKERSALAQNEEDRLKIHASYSSTSAGSPSSRWAIPFRAFSCTSKSLHGVCQEYQSLIAASAEAHRRGEGLVWDLMGVLFGSINVSHKKLWKSGSAPRGMEGLEEASQDEEQQMQCHGGGRNNVGMTDVDGADAMEMIDCCETISEGEESVQRSAAISHWLRRASSKPVAHSLPTSPCFAVFQQLARRDVANAVGLAVEQGDVHLATLLAQAGARSKLAADLHYQLELWEDHGNLAHFDPERVRLYRLLAGCVEESLHGMEVGWRTCVGLHLWYASGPNEPLCNAWMRYQEAVSLKNAPFPCPLYQEYGTCCMEMENSVQAMDYYLLLLHVCSEDGIFNLADAVSLLCPSSVSPYPLDYAASWHVGTVLASLGVLDMYGIHRNLLTTVTQRYLSQVQRMDVPVVWQVYVAIHIPDRYVREAVLEELLTRTAWQWWKDQEVQKQLHDHLHVPTWHLYHALAVLHRSRGDNREELDALLKALRTVEGTAVATSEQASGDKDDRIDDEQMLEDEYHVSNVIQRAHTLLHTSVAPLLLCNDEVEELRRLLDALLPFASRIGGWWQGAGLYLAHLTLLEGQPCLDEDAHVEALAGSWSSQNQGDDQFHLSRRAFATMATALAESFSQRTADLEVVRLESGELDGSSWEAQLQLHALAVELPALPELERMGAVHEAADAYATWLATACIM